MEIVKNVRISLTMGDLEQHMGVLTKEQLIEKFRIMLDKKEMEINEKIEKNNAEHLLLLQKKMLVLQKKDDQIVNLNNMISIMRNELHQQKANNLEMVEELMDLKCKIGLLEKKNAEFDNIFKEEKGKREKLKKDYDKLSAEHKALSAELEAQTRTLRKLKEQKGRWQEETQLILKNDNKKHEQEVESKVSNLKSSYQLKIHQLQSLLGQEKTKHESYKQKYLESKKNASSLSRAIQLLNKEIQNQKIKARKNIKQTLQAEAQTEPILIEKAYLMGLLFRQEFLKQHFHSNDRKQPSYPNANNLILQQPKTATVESQLQTDPTVCQQCLKMKQAIQALEYEMKYLKPAKPKKSAQPRLLNTAVQATPEPIIKAQGECQTIFSPLSQQEEQQLMYAFHAIKRSSQTIIRGWELRYSELEGLFLGRPARMQDRERIYELEKANIMKQIELVEKQRAIESLQALNSQLQKSIQQQKNFYSQFNMSAIDIKNTAKKYMTESALAATAPSLMAKTRHSFRMSIRGDQKSASPSPLARRRSQSLNLPESHSPKKKASLEEDPKEDLQALIIQETQSQLGDEEMDENKSSLLQTLVEKGIVFKSKDTKSIIDNMSAIRSYKKYKGSLKKVTL